MDQRRRSRTNAEFSAVIAIDGREISVVTRNISMKGLLATGHPAFAAGDTCTVLFALSKEVRFSIRARVVRAGESEAAFDFIGMDERAFAHLRNMVKFNSANPDQVDRELAAPVFSDDADAPDKA